METKRLQKKLSDFPKHKSNPFFCDRKLLDSLKGKGYTKRYNLDVKELGFVKNPTGTGSLNLYKLQNDGEVFLKSFKSLFDILPDLNKSGISILSLFFDNLNFNNCEIYLPENMVITKLGWKTKKPYYSGITSLVKNGIIACSKRPSLFYVNPNMVFKGDRTKLLENIKPLDTEDLIDIININIDQEDESATG